MDINAPPATWIADNRLALLRTAHPAAAVAVDGFSCLDAAYHLLRVNEIASLRRLVAETVQAFESGNYTPATGPDTLAELDMLLDAGERWLKANEAELRRRPIRLDRRCQNRFTELVQLRRWSGGMDFLLAIDAELQTMQKIEQAMLQKFR